MNQRSEPQWLRLRYPVRRGKIVFSWLEVVSNVRMTLATILLIGIFCASPAVSSAARYYALSAKQSGSSGETQSQAPQSQGAASPTTPVTSNQSPPPSTTSAAQSQTSTTKRKHHKKKVPA